MYFNGVPVWENQNALFCRNRQDKGEMLYAAFNLNVYTKNLTARRMHFGNETNKNISSSIGCVAFGNNLVWSKKQP